MTDPLTRGTLPASAVVERSVVIMAAFRRVCQRAGYDEGERVPLVSKHDPTIRFTNSTISVLKSRLVEAVGDATFLLQPALRLRNLSFWTKHRRMSGFGCYFMAFGALAPMSELRRMHEHVTSFIVDELGVARERVLLRVPSQNEDLVAAALYTAIAIEYDGYDRARFRHKFGDDALTGRNNNFAIQTPRGAVDIANIIVIEREGRPIGVEMAFGVNMVIAQLECLAHPVEASVGAIAGALGFPSLIAQDAMGAASALALEAMKPVARGRGGNYLAILEVLAEVRANPEALRAAARAVTSAETELRRHASPYAAGSVADVNAEEAADALVMAVEAVQARTV